MAASAPDNLGAMKDTAFSFLTGVLGTDGARALRKAADREPALEPLLVPRAALSWILQRSHYEGKIPGVSNSYLKLDKSEAGITGVVSLQDTNYEFSQATPEHVASAMSVSVGIDLANRMPVKDLLLVRLGKSIDALVKAQALTKQFVNKIELPGATAKPTKQIEPIQAMQPTKQTAKPKLPKKPKIPALKVEKSEAGRECEICGGTQFEGTQFKGCLCFRELSKSVKTTAYGDGFVLEFSAGIDYESAYALRRAFKGD
jgi:hypothetical protein